MQFAWKLPWRGLKSGSLQDGLAEVAEQDYVAGFFAFGQPQWISLPAMMRIRISTPHYLQQMKGKVSPYGFVLHPRTREKAKLTLLTPLNKKRSTWAKAFCINTRDGTTTV